MAIAAMLPSDVLSRKPPGRNILLSIYMPNLSAPTLRCDVIDRRAQRGAARRTLIHRGGGIAMKDPEQRGASLPRDDDDWRRAPQRLRRLGEMRGYQVASGDPDVRGWWVRTADRAWAGTVHDLVVDM